MGFNYKQFNAQYVLNAKNNGEPINDAAKKYGVRVVKADVSPGETYWKIIGVHHLLPRENFSNHHLYLGVLDENGNRIKNPFAWLWWTWVGRRPEERADPIPLDKPDFEVAGNVAMHFGQIVSAQIVGTQRDGNDKSDRVENVHTAHPDEPLPDGSLLNTIGHHSFYVVFQRTRKEDKATVKGIIKGRVDRGQGYTAQLLRNGSVVAQQRLGNNLTFKFADLPFGLYQLTISNTNINQSINLNDSNKEININLAVPPPTSSVIFGTVINGQNKILLLTKGSTIINRSPLSQTGQYRFEGLAAGSYGLFILDTNIRQGNIGLDGTNQREINLTLPGQKEPQPVEKSINHYLLLGPPNSRGRQTNLLLAANYILAFSVTVGFNVEEAKKARQVTIIGEGVSGADQQAIRNSGSQVEILTGDSYAIEAKLNAFIQTGRSFNR